MSSHRTEYSGDGLSEAELAGTPYDQVRAWVEQARARAAEVGDVPEPDALSVATVDGAGPDVRTVLLRFLDPRGPGFVTNLDSAKGRQLRENPALAASLTWPSMFRAIRFRGVGEVMDRAEVEDYFRQRPWGARISAWASAQSQPVASREQLEAAFAEYAVRYPDHGRASDVPLPPSWGAVRLRPTLVEFWGGRVNRLHDRLVFHRRPGATGDLADAASWELQRLQP